MSACSSPSPGKLDIDGDEVTEAKLNGIPESQSAGRVRQRRVPDPRRRREVPDRLRPAEALRHVRRQAAVGLERRADPVTAQPDPPGQGRHVHPRLPQRRRGDPRRLRAVLRHHRRPADRPEPALRHPPRPRRVRRAVARRDRDGRRPAADRRHRQPRPGARRARPRRSTGSTHLDEDEQERFVDALQRFVRTYGFLSQVVSFTDAKLHRDYLYCKALAAFTKVGRRRRRPSTPGRWSNSPTCASSSSSKAPSPSSDTVGEVVVGVRRQRQAPRTGRGTAVADHRADQRTVRHQLRPEPTGCSSTPSPTSSCAAPTSSSRPRPTRRRTSPSCWPRSSRAASSTRWPPPRT